MGIAILVIGLLLVVGGYVYLGISLKKTVKAPKKAIQKQQLVTLLGSIAASTLGGMLAQWGVHIVNDFAKSLTWYQQGMAILGGGLLMGGLGFLSACFVLRFYKTNISKKWLKKVKIGLYASIPFVFLSFLLFEEGAANAWSYPLISGIAINGKGVQFVTPETGTGGGFHLAWYGVFILAGFLTSYFICDHRFYQKYGKHGILENCLIVVFIFGILGARLWYVVGNWNGDTGSLVPFSERVANGDILSIFAFWEGGLTVLGGVVFGIASGWIYFKLFRKYIPVTFPLDVVVPSILVAQAIGRWGNFFNHEVYGAEVLISDGWWWLPTFIQKEMGYGLPEGHIYVPLFLIEGMINLAGFFLIYFGVPALWKARPVHEEIRQGKIVEVPSPDLSGKGLFGRLRYTRAPGVLAGFYMIFYGIVRMILEPLRDPTYNMGTSGSWSFWNAMAYVIIGIVMIAWLQFYEYLLREKVEARRLAKANKANSDNDEIGGRSSNTNEPLTPTAMDEKETIIPSEVDADKRIEEAEKTDSEGE